MAKRTIFSGMTPLGDRVVVTRDRWREIVRYKHPAIAGHEGDVCGCLRDPDRVLASNGDPTVHPYYRRMDKCYVCAVIGGENRNCRFLVTAYFTAKIKKGTQLWTK